ncbi:TonB-dependent receptor plug domain-containing protein [Planctobacterium marinum]|uniref:TonB-dependent receptor plug domain-containing protein n=1 Tax=Planctobacterium marinum TaxID=1631968 RepID=UPI001E410EB1|nr:TonB-dependent receptor [Planctobacterium marinum]MCC2607227.1 TonB-dependent receptor [Planctobacterium marinum]
MKAIDLALMQSPLNIIKKSIPFILILAPELTAQPMVGEIDEEDIEQVHVIGTRNFGRSSAELPVAVDAIDAERLRNSGHLEVGRMLQNTAPSFNFSSSAISDGTDAIRPATLRGLGPDQTLVLINNKRRHSAALLHINTSVGRGTSGTDLNAIPVAAIKRIEILRDGAAAQYGSDAIAGVINIILKDDEEYSSIYGSYGVHQAGDGNTAVLAANHSFEFDTGSINATLEVRDRGDTNRAGLTGVCQYLFTCSDIDADGIPETDDSRELTFPRQNFHIGDAQVRQVSGVINGYKETFGGEYYGFITLSHKNTLSSGFFRRANETEKNPVIDGTQSFYPDGFLPEIAASLLDYSVSAGYSTLLQSNINLDVSATFGGNTMQFDVNNSVNASFVQHLVNSGTSAAEILAVTPTSADSGKLSSSLATLNIDFVSERIRKNYAWGAELRLDSYQIDAGSEYSWQDFDGIEGGGDAGIQVFPGFSPMNSVDETRFVYSAYFDAEWDLSSRSLLNGALRFDHYEGFGNTLNLKLAGRHDFDNRWGIRTSFNTGFRAPSMQQLYFNNISTQFNNGVAAQVGTFRNDSQLAKELGIPQLEEEKSISVNAGLLYTGQSLTATLDFYLIKIDDRIVISEQLTRGLGSAILDDVLQNNGVQSAQFFLNAAETETKGVDLVISWFPDVPQGALDFTFAVNATDTQVVAVKPSGGLNDIDEQDLFGEQARSIIEEWQPASHAIVSANYQIHDWVFTASTNRYGRYRVIDADQSQRYSAKWLADVRASYQLSENTLLHAGINNLTNTYPDKNRIGQSRAGRIETIDGNVLVDSPGVFTYSRRAAPFGFNGRFYYVGMESRF